MNPYAAIFAAVVLAVAGYKVGHRTDKATAAAPGQTEDKPAGGSAVPFLDQLFGGKSYGNLGTNSMDAGWAGVDTSDTGPQAEPPPPTAITTTPTSSGEPSRSGHVASDPRYVAIEPSRSGNVPSYSSMPVEPTLHGV